MRPGAPGHRPDIRNRDPDKVTCDMIDWDKTPDRAPDPDKGTGPDKAVVLGWIEELARAGLARSRALPGGGIELRLVTGEVFRLARNALVRIS